MFFLPPVPVLSNDAAVPGKAHSSSDPVGLCKGVESASGCGNLGIFSSQYPALAESKTGRERTGRSWFSTSVGFRFLFAEFELQRESKSVRTWLACS